MSDSYDAAEEVPVTNMWVTTCVSGGTR
jgi:hypothetical protein